MKTFILFESFTLKSLPDRPIQQIQLLLRVFWVHVLTHSLTLGQQSCKMWQLTDKDMLKVSLQTADSQVVFGPNLVFVEKISVLISTYLEVLSLSLYSVHIVKRRKITIVRIGLKVEFLTCRRIRILISLFLFKIA